MQQTTESNDGQPFVYPLSAKPVQVLPGNHLGILPSSTSSPNDYDFLMGRHAVHHKKLKARFANCHEWINIDGEKTTEKILSGLGNIERHSLPDANDKFIEAIALRLFNPQTRLWSLYWADDIHGTLDSPLTGSFEHNLGVFFGWDSWNGKPILVQFQYDRKDPENPVWGQAFSVDNGLSWEWNWFMFFKKL